jgi:beta-phosphoglucomutase
MNADRKAQAVIFDVDGVLIDSYAAHFESWSALATETGIRFTESDFVRTFGQTSRDILARFWTDRVLDDSRIKSLDDRKESLFRQIVERKFPFMPGAVALIDALHQAGFKIAAGSSGPPENVELVLCKLDRRDRFDAIITGRDVTRGKPDPQVFLLASTQLRIEPCSCCVVEDAPAGLEAAHRAGMASIGLASTGRRREDLRGADLVVDSLDALSPASIAAVIAARNRGPS